MRWIEATASRQGSLHFFRVVDLACIWPIWSGTRHRKGIQPRVVSGYTRATTKVGNSPSQNNDSHPLGNTYPVTNSWAFSNSWTKRLRCLLNFDVCDREALLKMHAEAVFVRNLCVIFEAIFEILTVEYLETHQYSINLTSWSARLFRFNFNTRILQLNYIQLNVPWHLPFSELKYNLIHLFKTVAGKRQSHISIVNRLCLQLITINLWMNKRHPNRSFRFRWSNFILFVDSLFRTRYK